MNKRRLHHIWTKMRFIQPWYFLVLAITFSVICVFALRANNQHMIVLRNQVYAADKNNSDVQGSLRKLQAYVTSHMNTNLSAGNTSVYPPVQLKYTYERLVKAQEDQLSQAHSQLYSQAQAYCEARNHVDFSGRNRVPCIEQYVQSHSVATSPQIPEDLYKFSFASPTWSPDLAGWSMAAAIVCLLLFLVTLPLKWWLRRK